MRHRAIGKLGLLLILWALMAPFGNPIQASAVDSSPNCGIYSLYTAMRIEGLKEDLSDLLKPQYISTKEGSTLTDLALAAQDRGMFTRVMSNLTVSDLRSAESPLLLHVKNEYDAPAYNHFVLCVPGKNGRIAIYDAPQALVWSTGDDLAAVWDGTALAVSAHPIRLSAGWEGSLKWGLFGIAGIILASVAGRTGGLRRLHVGRGVFSQALAISSIAAALAVVQHCGTAQGFQSQKAAVFAMQAANFGQPCPAVNVAETRSLMARGAYLIDARTPSDFREGHIEAAINVPANASRQTRAAATADVPKHSMVIVYCQSASCPFAPFIARRLKADGFANVRVLREGWEAWNAEKAAGQRPKVTE